MDPVDFGETLLTAFIKLKLDPTTMRDWQHSTQEYTEVPPFEDLLNLLDLQARDTENSVHDVVKETSHSIKSWHTRMTTILCMDV